jgi:pilus assembly protein CpaF
MEGDIITMQDLFLFERKGMTEDGSVTGAFRARGIRPRSAERLQAVGINLEETLFADAPGWNR